VEIKGKVALVTGGAVRIGRAICENLAGKGAKVAVHYNRSEKEAKDLRLETFQADLSNASDIEKLVQEVEKKLGPIQVLINNASIFKKTPLFEIRESDWEKHININLRAPFLLAQVVSKGMLERKQGKIINIADYAAKKPYKDYLPYIVSKGGVVALTKTLAKELAPYVQVNAIAPGPTIPPSYYSENQKEKVANQTLLKRWGDPKEIANAVCFLIEGTDFATGSVLTIEGGRLLV